MTIATRVGVLVVVLSATSAAAEDAYYHVPLGELKITDGELPQPSARPPEARPAVGLLPWTWGPNWPYATVEGGEAYVSAPGWNGPGNFSPSGTPGSTDPRSLAVRAPKGQDVAGRLFLPNPEGTGRLAIGFVVPAQRASESARIPFFQAKSAHYSRLQSAGFPGGAWFRHQARQAQKEVGLPPVQGPGMGPFPGQFQRFPQRPADLASTYALFTGGRAVSENLQLDRLMAETLASSPAIPVDSIPGVTTREIDWGPLIDGLEPDRDPLAALVPADQYLLVFPNVEAAAQIGDLMSEGGTIFLRLAEPRVEDSRIIAKYERQLGLSISDAARVLKALPIRSLAVTGSDLYFSQGTDLAILLETPEPERLAAMLLAQIGLSTVGDASAEWSVGEMGGLAYRGVCNPDRTRSSYVARLPGAVVVTNSLYQLRRLAGVREDKSQSIASLAEYTFFRARYVRGDEAETAFGLLSDAAIRRLCGPRWRIGASRRTRDAAVMAGLQADHLDELVAGNVAPRPISPDTRLATPARLSLTASGVLSSNAGTLDFMTPISELPLDRVTQEEATAYEQWRQGYERNWTWAFDPMALRLSVREKQVAADLTVMPLIVATQYRPIVSITQGAELAPDAGDPHGALAHAVLAVNTKSELFDMGRRFTSRTPLGPAVDPFGWIGQSVAAYADDDPFWKELADVPEAERQAFLEKEGWRLPVGVQVEVSSGLKLTAFLTAVRTLVDQSAPGMAQWETRTHHDEPYTKVSLTERGRRGHRALDQAALYYAASGDALVVSTSEDVLKRAIDRQLQRGKTGDEDRPATPPGHSWLGKSVGVEVDAKLVEAVVRFGRNEYQAMMQARSWANLPILNEWKRRYPDEDPITLHQRFWQTRLVCPGGGEYVWNDRWHSFESTVYGHPGEPKPGPAVPPALSAFARGNFGLTFEHQGLRAQVSLDRVAPDGPSSEVASKPVDEQTPAWTRLGEGNTEIGKALAALEAKPTDPDANLAVGKFLCVEKGDWERGIPLLVLGSDAALKSAAAKEWAGAATPEELLRFATAWWDLAQTKTGREKQACLLRAGAWYQAAGKTFSATRPDGKELAARLAAIGEIGGKLPALPARRSLAAMALHEPPPPLRRDAAPDDASSRNLRQIGLALHIHHDVYKTFPPAYRSGRDGKPRLSWRVLILPYLEQQPLYEQFRLDERWDSEHNKRLIPQMPAVFRSPLSRAEPGKTNYLGVGGGRGIFPGKEAISFARIPDGTSNTIAVVEVDDAAAIEWTRPGDFEPNVADLTGILGGLRDGRFLALFGDGSTSLISSRVDRAVLNGLFTRDGGEPFGFPAWSSAVAPQEVAAELAEEDVGEVEKPAEMAQEATVEVEEPRVRPAPPRAQLATESPFLPQAPAEVTKPRERFGRGMAGPPYAVPGEFTFVDLQPKANCRLDQGQTSAENHFGELPRGRQTFAGVPFEIGQAMLQLGGRTMPDVPDEIRQIPVNARAAKLHFLHSTQWGGSVSEGTAIGRYVVHYEDGSEQTVPIVVGEDVQDWWDHHRGEQVSRGKFAWTGSNPAARRAGAEIRLFLSTWQNPWPDKLVAAIDYVLADKSAAAAPFCVAITAESRAEQIPGAFRLPEIALSERAPAAVRQAIATLREKPEDPEANLVVGRHLAVEGGDWEHAIPLLALGSDEGLKTLAQRELQGTDSYHEQVEIGDGWWELAEGREGSEKEAILLRAGSWYAEARKAQLTSVLLRAKLDKRLGEITRLGHGIPPLRVARPGAPAAPSIPARPESPAVQVSPQEEYQQAVAEIQKLGGRFLVKGYKPSWAPDGTRIAFSHRRIEDGVGVVDLSTGAVTTVVAPGKDPAWSPDGKHIAYVAIPNRRDEEVWLVESTGANPRRLAEGGFPTWSSDGKMLFYQSRKEGRLKMIETPESEPVVREGIRLPFYYPAISPDDKRLVYRLGNELRLVSLQTGEPVRRWPLTPSVGLVASFSPDGKQLGFGGWGGHDRLDLSIVDLQTGRTRQLLSRQFTLPVWSPDGSKLTVDLRARGTIWDVWLLDAKVLETIEATPPGVERD